MADIVFEWDEAKNQANQRKHGLSFEDAIELFSDPLCVSIPDRVVDGEQRWRSYGFVKGSLLLIAVNTVSEEFEDSPVEIIRIISARYADGKDRRIYENENG